MGIELLGPLRIDGEVVALQRRDQVVLSALAVRAGEALSVDQLADALWGEEPPSSWPKQIHGSVLRLRRTLGAAAVETTGAGYRLTVAAEELDCRLFERLVARASGLVADGEFDRAAVLLGRALDLWRGGAFDVLDSWSPGRIAAARLGELRLTAEESLLDARLASGEHRELVSVAEARVAEQPLREHRWAILATALYRCGRQADALRALRHARGTLAEQLGIQPGAELVALEQAVLRQDPALLAVPAPPMISQHCPYKGLVPYDVDDTETFFGRDSEVAACVERLRSCPVLVVTGPSGCGKSSLVRAGLLPALRQAGYATVVFVPGGDPMSTMTEALALSEAVDPVVVIDQFEELFTLDDGASPQSRSFCARLVNYAATSAPVVITVRADHVADLAVDTEFAALTERGLHLVKPLTGESLRQAIEGPAQVAGLRLEPGLVDLLVRDSEGEPGALPLLSHALAETWRRRDGRVLTVEGYRATGEIKGAVARSADRLYESLPAEQRPKLRAMLLRLVAPSPDGEPVRSRVATRSLGGDVDRDRVLGLLVRARLVITEEESVELAHEALARAWPRLRSWLEEDAAGQRVLRHLSTAADGWDSLGRPVSELYRGARLEAALEWRATTSTDLTDREAEFLEASVAEAANERAHLAARAERQARQNRRLRRALAAVGVLLVAAATGGTVAYQQRQSARREERTAALTALTTNAAALRTNRRDVAALLAVEAYRLAPGPATESALFGTFTAAPEVVRVVHTELEMAAGDAPSRAVPDSDFALVGDPHGGADLIDLSTGRHTTLDGASLETGFSDVAVSADGRAVAGAFIPPNFTEEGSGYTLLSVWDIATRQRRFDPVRVPFPGVPALSGDGSRVVVSGGRDGETAIYDGLTGELVANLGPTPRPAQEGGLRLTAAPMFAADGNLLVGSMNGPILVIDPTDGSLLRHIEAAPMTTEWFLFASADGRRVVSVGSSRPNEFTWPVSVFDYRTGDLLSGPTWIPKCNNLGIFYLEQLDAMACPEASGSLSTYDVVTGAERDVLLESQQGNSCAAAVSADGTRLYQFAGCRVGTMSVVEWRFDGGGSVSRQLVDPGRHEGWLPGYGLGAEPGDLAVMFGDGTGTDSFHESPTEGLDVEVVDPASGSTRITTAGLLWVWPTGVPGSVVAQYDDRSVRRFDLATGEPAGPAVEAAFEIVDLASDGDTVIVRGDEETEAGIETLVQRVDLLTGAPVGEPVRLVDLWVYERQGRGMTAGPDGLYLVGQWPTDQPQHIGIQRRDPDSGELLAQLPDYAVFTIGGGVAIAASADGDLIEVDRLTLEPLGAPFPGVNGEVSKLSLDDRGRRLLVHGADGTLRLYDVATRTQLGDPIRGVAKSPPPWGSSDLRGDGLELAADNPRGVIVWDLDPQHWIAAACRLAGRNLTRAEWDQYIGDLAPHHQTCPAFAAAYSPTPE